VPAAQVTETLVPLVPGVHVFVVSVQDCVLATPDPVPSPGVNVTVWSVPTHAAGALLVVVGAPASTVRATAVPVPVPPAFVARMFSVSAWPFVPVIPVFVHV